MRRPDLVLIAALAVGSVIAGITPSADPFIRTAGAILLTSLLPGYAVTAALFSRPKMAALERVVLSISLSLAFAAIGAVVLNLIPNGIRGDTWALLLGGITLAGCAVAARIHHGGPRFNWAVGRWGPVLRRSTVPTLMLALAAAITFGAFQVAAQGARNQGQVPFTQVWLLPTTDPGSVTLGIRNVDQEPLIVRVVVVVNEEPKAEWPSIAIGPDETWERVLDVSDFVVTGAPIDALLYREGEPDTPFRQARLWLE